MKIKRIFGALLTVLGTGGLGYTAFMLLNTSGGTRDIRVLLICGILGLVSIKYGISRVRTSKDESL